MHSESTPRAISRNQSAISMHSESTPHLLTTARLRERMAPNSSKLRTSSVARSAPDEGGPRMQSACTPYAIRGNQHALRGARTHPSDAQRTLNEGGNQHAIRAQSARNQSPNSTHPSERCPTDPAAAPAEMQISRREISRRGAYRSEGSRRRSSAQIESRAHLARRRAPPAAPQAAARVVRDARRCRYATTTRLQASSVGKQRVAASLSSAAIRGHQLRASSVGKQRVAASLSSAAIRGHQAAPERGRGLAPSMSSPVRLVR
jgi:hypothetical protein